MSTLSDSNGTRRHSTRARARASERRTGGDTAGAPWQAGNHLGREMEAAATYAEALTSPEHPALAKAHRHSPVTHPSLTRDSPVTHP